MDTGKGYFVPVLDTTKDDKFLKELEKREIEEKYPLHGGTFYVGQNLEFGGSKFRVLTITKKTITLRVLPK